ncbi:MAG: hypothetical protein AB2A00_27440 [Myxococcota bacterium]
MTPPPPLVHHSAVWRAWFPSSDAPAFSVLPAQRDEGRAPQRVLALLVVFSICSGAWWLHVDTQALQWDQARHAWNALRLLAFLREEPWTLQKLGDTLAWHDQQYGVVGYLPSTILHAIWGRAPDLTALPSVLLWTPLLVVSMFALGRMALGSSWAGVAAAALTLASPMVADLAKDALLDLPILSLTAATAACVVWSRFMRWRGPAVLAGVGTGALAVVKAAVPAVFVVGPLLWSLVLAWRGNEGRERRRNLGWAALAALLVCGPYAVSVGRGISRMFASQSADAAREGDAITYVDGLLAHLHWLADITLRGPLWMLALVGAVLLLRRARDVGTWVVTSLAVSVLAWPFFPNKDARYTIGALVYAALCGAWLLRGRAAALVTTSFSVLSVLAIQWGVPVLPERIAVGPVLLWAQQGYLRHTPDRRDSVAEQLMRAAVERWGNNTTRALLQADAGVDEAHLNLWNLVHLAWVTGRHVDVIRERPRDVDGALDFRVVTGMTASGAPPPGWETVLLTTSPDGKPLALWFHVERERMKRAAQPISPRSFTHGPMQRTVTHAGAFSTGNQVRVVVRLDVVANRNPTPLTHVFCAGETCVRRTWPDEYAQAGLPQWVDATLEMPGDVEVQHRVEDREGNVVLPLGNIPR